MLKISNNMAFHNIHHSIFRCFDKNGENVYLPCDLKGKFSAIAKEDNISGVHTVENLTTKRLPVMTRLIHGLPPVGLKSAQAFLPEMRLNICSLCPMGRDSFLPRILIYDFSFCPFCKM